MCYQKRLQRSGITLRMYVYTNPSSYSDVREITSCIFAMYLGNNLYITSEHILYTSMNTLV